MSRLDDELRVAFKREQPPADFTTRVLERVARQPEPRQSWWQRLAAMLEPPKLRWVAIGVTASILLAIGASQWSRLNRKAMTEDNTVAHVTARTDDGVKPDNSVSSTPTQQSPKPVVQPGQKVKRPPRLSEQSMAQIAKDRELRAEGEAAKEKLMMALSIASSTLNDAQKAVHDDGPKP